MPGATDAAAVEGVGELPDEEEKNHVEEEDKKLGEGGGTHINPDINPEGSITSSRTTLDGQELQLLGGAEKTHVLADTKEPTSEGGSAMIIKEQTCLLAVPEEEDASKKLQLKNKKHKKRKRSEVDEQIKKVQLLGGAEKSQVPVDAEKPSSVACCPCKWRATYTTDIKKRVKRLGQDLICLQDAEVNRVVLLEPDGTIIDAYCLKEGEVIKPGSLFEFPCHNVEVGEPILQSKEDLPLMAIKDEGEGELLGGADDKKRKRLKRKNEDMIKELKKVPRKKGVMPVRLPQVNLMRSSLGMLARVASLRKRLRCLAFSP